MPIHESRRCTHGEKKERAKSTHICSSSLNRGELGGELDEKSVGIVVEAFSEKEQRKDVQCKLKTDPI